MIHLSHRQYECVRGVAQGLPDRQIAAQLGIEYGTVKQHLQCARNKTGASNRTELAVMFVRGAIQAPAAEVA